MYNPLLSYEENLERGPAAEWDSSGSFPLIDYTAEPRFSVLGVPLHVPLGIPAGPLLSAAFVRVALDAGFSMPVYKTVRSTEWKSHPWPNVLGVAGFSVETNSERPVATVVPLQQSAVRALRAGTGMSITNAFGVPSQTPAAWSKDFQSLPAAAFGKGQQTVLSFQGSRRDGESWSAFLDDTTACARLAAQATDRVGGSILEMNVSCPNESGAPIYGDFRALEQTLVAASSALREFKGMKLIVKLGVLAPRDCDSVVGLVARYAHGISAINTLSATIVSQQGEKILGSGASHGGICGDVIRTAAVRMVGNLASARSRLGLAPSEFAIIGVGGCSSYDHLKSFLSAGADIVHAATGAMWNLGLAAECAHQLGVPYRQRSLN